MTTINFGSTVSLAQAASLTLACGSNIRPLFVGEPGIGKSSMMGMFEKQLGDAYNYAYVDCSNLDLGDVAMPVVDHPTKTTRYYPNARFKLHEGKPVVIMLDEFGKAPQPVQNMLHPMLESRNPRLGDVMLPEGSIVFLTSNMSSDGVGDNIKAHTLNRVTRVQIAKPDAESWMQWAIENGVSPVVLAWVRQFSHCMASYMDGDQNENPYIYNPKKFQTSYVSPRSLELASRIVSKRDQFDSDTLIAALRGTIGESAARDMEAFIAYQDELPTRDSIIANPLGAPVPTSAGATIVLVFGLIASASRDNITAFMQYVGRLESEWQAVFGIHLARSPSKQSVAFGCKAFTNWARENQDILG